MQHTPWLSRISKNLYLTSVPSQLRLRKKENLNKKGQDSFASYFAWYFNTFSMCKLSNSQIVLSLRDFLYLPRIICCLPLQTHSFPGGLENEAKIVWGLSEGPWSKYFKTPRHVSNIFNALLLCKISGLLVHPFKISCHIYEKQFSRPHPKSPGSNFGKPRGTCETFVDASSCCKI